MAGVNLIIDGVLADLPVLGQYQRFNIKETQPVGSLEINTLAQPTLLSFCETSLKIQNQLTGYGFRYTTEADASKNIFALSSVSNTVFKDDVFAVAADGQVSFTSPVAGADPVDDNHFATKKFVLANGGGGGGSEVSKAYVDTQDLKTLDESLAYTDVAFAQASAYTDDILAQANAYTDAHSGGSSTGVGFKYVAKGTANAPYATNFDNMLYTSLMPDSSTNYLGHSVVLPNCGANEYIQWLYKKASAGSSYTKSVSLVIDGGNSLFQTYWNSGATAGNFDFQGTVVTCSAPIDGSNSYQLTPYHFVSAQDQKILTETLAKVDTARQELEVQMRAMVSDVSPKSVGLTMTRNPGQNIITSEPVDSTASSFIQQIRLPSYDPDENIEWFYGKTGAIKNMLLRAGMAGNLLEISCTKDNGSDANHFYFFGNYVTCDAPITLPEQLTTKAYVDAGSVKIGGVIFVLNGNAAPSNYLNCNGGAYSATTYPALKTALMAAGYASGVLPNWASPFASTKVFIRAL